MTTNCFCCSPTSRSDCSGCWQHAQQLWQELYSLHSSLYRALAAVARDWSVESTVAHVFPQLLGGALQAYRVYSSNQTEALAFAEQLRFEMRIPDLEWRGLESFLIQPIQRVPRYQMLLREIAANTAPNHAEHERVATALQLLARCGHSMQQGMERAQHAHYMRHEMAGCVQDLPEWCHEQSALRCSEMRWLVEERKACVGGVIVAAQPRSTAAAAGAQGVRGAVRRRGHASARVRVGAGQAGTDHQGRRFRLRKRCAFVAERCCASVTVARAGASIASPLGSTMEAHTKSWKFKREHRVNGAVACAGPVPGSFVAPADDEPHLTLQCASPAEAQAWIAAINESQLR